MGREGPAVKTLEAQQLALFSHPFHNERRKRALEYILYS
jgi:hypothetical protein